ncbi:MAG: [LysW]-lysine hydrolase [Halobacteriales archaeon]
MAGTDPIDADVARELVSDLVDIPSPSGEERMCAERLQAFFETHTSDREVWIDEVGNVRAPADDVVLYTSHIDTVPGDIPVRIEDETLWGRGSVDAKGPLAAMAVAAARTGVSFAGVVGEEADSRGARHLIADRAPPAAVLNGEPSGWDAVTLGYRGMLAGTYTVTSDAGHSSRPENNAVEDAIDWWHALRATFATDPDTPVVEQVTPKATAIQGGLSDDGLAVEATLEIQFRIPAGTTIESVKTTVMDSIQNGSIDWMTAIPPVMCDHRAPPARALRGAIRRAGGDPRLLRKTGTADMNLFAEQWDCPMATYGPGDSDLDHAPDERLSLAEYDRGVTVLTDVARSLRED